MIRKTLIFLFAVMCFSTELAAQSLELFKVRLAQPDSTVARVKVSEYGDAVQIVHRAAENSMLTRFRGYRVCIFFDNGESARAKAVEAKLLLETTFPDTRVYMVYENPYFKVTIGNCVTVEEAIILMGRVDELFPKAFLKNEELLLTDLVIQEKNSF